MLIVKPFVPRDPYPYQIIQAAVLTRFVQQNDVRLLFRETDPVCLLEDGDTMLDLLTKTRVFSSRGQARKAGWDKPIPDGYTELRLGKTYFFLWKPTE